MLSAITNTKNNNVIKPLQAFVVLLLLTAIVAIGRYILAGDNKPDVIINFSPILAIVAIAALFKLAEEYINPLFFLSISFITLLFLWSYQQSIEANKIDYIILAGTSTLLVWHSLFSRISLAFSALIFIVFVAYLKYEVNLVNSILVMYVTAGFMALSLAIYIQNMFSALKRKQSQSISNPVASVQKIPEPLFAETFEVEAAPVMSMMQITDPNEAEDWSSVIQGLYTVLQPLTDVDQIFNKTLKYLHKTIDYDAAAVGMLQEKSINKIAVLGPENLLHSSVIDWNDSRLKEIKISAETVLNQQKYLGVENKSIALYRMDIPVISNQNVLGVVSVFRNSSLFNEYEVKIASSLIFHCMIALRQSRLQEEIKKLSTNSKNKTLYSREQFIEKSNKELKDLNKPRGFSVLIAEIDGFDDYKTKHGAETALVIYKKIATAIMSVLDAKDILGRYGKEGFVILLHETDLLEAKKVAESICNKVEKTKFKIPSGVSSTTTSIGLTTVSDQNDNMMSIIRKADMGLFVAKESGFNSVKVSL